MYSFGFVLLIWIVSELWLINLDLFPFLKIIITTFEHQFIYYIIW